MVSNAAPSLPAVGRRCWNYLRRGVRIDTRTLAVFRVLVGLLIIADLLLRARNFSYFYTDDGVVPRSLLTEVVVDPGVSIYHYTTDPTIIAGLFVLQGLIAVQLIVGFKTRTATICSFLFVISLDHHNPFVLSYADTLFRLLLFWAIFLPLGERWSIDAVHRERDPRPFVASIASALILGQMVYMYFTNALIKSRSDIWGTMDAAPLVLGLDEMTFLLGDVIREFQTLLGVGGVLWYYMLLFSWLLVLLRGRPRMAMVGLFVGGHLSFAITVRIGAFAYVALVGVILFLQAQFWDDARTVLRRVGVDASQFAERTARLEHLAARVPNYRITDERVRRARSYAYTAAIGIVVVSMLFVAGVLGATVAGEVVDDDSPRELEYRIDDAVHETLDEATGVRHIGEAASKFGIDQPIGWGVFAGPDPRTTDRYYVFPAETENGDLVDVYSERPLSYDRPFDELQTQHGTYRERFYMGSVRQGGLNDAIPERLADHICQQWAETHDVELVGLSMYMVEEEVTRETITDPTDREREYTEFYRHGCGDNVPRTFSGPA